MIERSDANVGEEELGDSSSLKIDQCTPEIR